MKSWNFTIHIFSPRRIEAQDLRRIRQLAEELLSTKESGSPPIFPLKDKLEMGSIALEAEKATGDEYILQWEATEKLIKALERADESKRLDDLPGPQAAALEGFQDLAREKGFRFEFFESKGINFSAPGVELKLQPRENRKALLSITPQTDYRRTPAVWIEGEFYFYGKVTALGGDPPVLTLETEEFGPLNIQAAPAALARHPSNPLYRLIGVRAAGRQHAKTGEIDTSRLRLLEVLEYNPQADPSYLEELIEKARHSWSDIEDADEWLKTLRHG